MNESYAETVSTEGVEYYHKKHNLAGYTHFLYKNYIYRFKPDGTFVGYCCTLALANTFGFLPMSEVEAEK